MPVRPRPRRFLVPLLAASAALLGSGRAHATPNFPDALAADIHLASSPDCSLCHTDGNQGGTGTVNTPFGKNMRARGLVAYDTASLSAALTLMSDEKVDSAGACLPDIEELQAGGDPNTPGEACDGGAPPAVTATSTLLPAYGCSASSRSDGGSSGSLVLVLASSLGIALARRRSRRSTS